MESKCQETQVWTDISPAKTNERTHRKRKPWKKILYERQDYDDDYVDEKFLEQLVTNGNFKKQDFWVLVGLTAAISQQISLLTIFFVLVCWTLNGAISIQFMLWLDCALMLGGYTVIWLTQTGSRAILLTNIKSSILFAGTLRLLSPVLHTVSRTYTDDTIYALTVALSGLHLLAHDYNYVNAITSECSGVLSLNAAVLTSVLLCSRMHSSDTVFGLVFLSFQLFAFYPTCQRAVKLYSTRVHACVTLLLGGGVVVLLLPSHPLLVWVYIGVTMFVCFLCPFWFVTLQRHKSGIQGPWDIAHVSVASS